MSGEKGPLAISRARLALEGLSVGDAFGENFFGSPRIVLRLIELRAVPAAPWRWTDDTAMACSVFEVLAAHGAIDRDVLAERFASRYGLDPRRGYGGTAHDILSAIGRGTPWREAAGRAFGGEGSMGNGSAMRVAPVGAYFAEDLDQAALHARLSAEPTHAHAEAHSGAVAVATAAALAWQMGNGARERSGADLLRTVVEATPQGLTRDGLRRALSIPFDTRAASAAEVLGNGSMVVCHDTVPFALWCAARHLADFEEAMWATVSALGDRDTTCAIVGGVVALSVGLAGIPEHFSNAREPLPKEK
jgi:ADP-ribosylglycohydrolase